MWENEKKHFKEIMKLRNYFCKNFFSEDMWESEDIDGLFIDWIQGYCQISQFFYVDWPPHPDLYPDLYPEVVAKDWMNFDE